MVGIGRPSVAVPPCRVWVMSRPVYGSFKGYRVAWLRGDVIAALTLWALLVPQCLAYASIAGLPPVVGLYAAVPALLLYAALGSSRHLVVAPISATAALSAGTVAVFADPASRQFVALSAALAIVTGVLALLAGALRLGFLASFISEPVLKGLIMGLALIIIVGQLPKLFGVSKGSGDFFQRLWELTKQLGQTSGWTLAVGVASLVVIFALKRWLPVVPGSLVAVVLGIVAVAVFRLEDKGVAIVGHIEPGLPRIGLPQVRAGDYLALVGPAAGLLLVGFAEGLGAAKTYAARVGDDVAPNRELLAVGAANVGAGLCSGMVVNGSLSKTAVNGDAGARSQLSTMLVAALTVVTLQFLTGLFEYLPEATLAAVVIAAVVELVDIPALRQLYLVWTRRLGGIYGLAARADFVAAMAAMLGVLIFDTLPGLFIGIAVSILLLTYRASRPHVALLLRATDPGPGGGAIWVDAERHPDAEAEPGVVVVRVESGLFFVNADFVRQRIRDVVTPETWAVVLDGETSPAIDITATTMLAHLADGLARQGVTLLVAHHIGQVRDVLQIAGATEQLRRVYPTVDAAVTAARSLRPLQEPDASS